MALLKIDFYFEVFKQTEKPCFELSHSSNIKTLEFTETNSYFYSFTYEKNIFSSSSYIPVRSR